jgi:hypothetical protein
VVHSKFLHVHVQTEVPTDIKTLAGKLRVVQGRPPDIDTFASTKIDSTGLCEFVIGHFNLGPNSTYLLRVADTLANETKCLASVQFKTRNS